MSNGYGSSATAPIEREQSIRLIVQACLNAGISNEKQIAYVLATAQHESQNFSALEEAHGRKQATVKGYEGGEEYFGRGYVHLTHDFNYRRMESKLGIENLHSDPQKAAEPQNAADIIAVGMRDGDYTGRRLSQYINGQRTDYLGARAIVNGKDRDKTVADLATTWETRVPELVRDIQNNGFTLPAPTPQQPAPNLHQGMANQDVFEMQQYLLALNITTDKGRAISPDGDFGSESHQAVVRYQKQAGIEPANGVVSQTALQQMREKVLQDDPDFKLKTYTAIHGPLNDNILTMGERGDPIRELKQQLDGLGHRATTSAEHRNKYDQATKNAVTAFQIASGITPRNGIADERTRDAINAAAVAKGLPETAEAIARRAEQEEREQRQSQTSSPLQQPNPEQPRHTQTQTQAQNSDYQSMFPHVLHQLHAAEQERGINAGTHSHNLAGVLTVNSLREGITPDRVELNRDGSMVRAVQFGPHGDDPILNRNTSAIATAEAIQVPEQHSAQLADRLQASQQQDQQSMALAYQQSERAAMLMS